MSKVKFTVYRSNWYRGHGPQGSALCLLNDREKMCCLGFLALRYGVPKEGIMGKGFLREIVGEGRSNIPPEVIDKEFTIGALNDAVGSDSYREESLRRHFEECGVEVEFVDGEMPSMETQ